MRAPTPSIACCGANRAATRASSCAGKRDALGALAVARLVLQDAAALPPVGAESATAVLDLLIAERDATLAEATRLRNQLHHLLLQLGPRTRPTCRRCGRDALPLLRPARRTAAHSRRPAAPAWPGGRPPAPAPTPRTPGSTPWSTWCSTA